MFKSHFFYFLFFIFLSFFKIFLYSLTLEEKIGQLFLVHFSGEVANEEAEFLIRQGHVSGFVFYNWSNTLSSPSQIRSLTKSLQTLNQEAKNPFPLLIAVDQEGGKVNRLKEGFTEFPSQKILGSFYSTFFSQEVAKAIGIELKSVGINVNFAPVCDLDASLANDRSYGKAPEKVAACAEAALKGYEQAGIIATLKHFPGLGSSLVDSHLETPLSLKNLDELLSSDFIPFQKLVKRSDMIMTGHILLPSLEQEPATFSSKILDELLRKKWGFEGVVISDSLVMKSLTPFANSFEEAALKALNAGCDLLCLGGKLLNESTDNEITPKKVLEIQAFLIKAVKEGLLSEEKIDKSIERITKLKDKYKCSNWEAHFHAEIPLKKHRKLKEEIEILQKLQNLMTEDLALVIGKEVWKNEGGGKKDKLLVWNEGENFLSLGIGHLIWYPEGVAEEKFQSPFAKFCSFLNAKNIPYPHWMKEKCPWKDRSDFLNAKNSEKRELLQQWFENHIEVQCEFMAQELFLTLQKMLQTEPILNYQRLFATIDALVNSPAGLLALIDYLNFKGSGLFSSERYQGHGWGLYQVLQKMEFTTSQNALEQFQQAAISILTERVKLAAPFRDETRWLKGWIQRIKRYSEFF